MPVKAIWQLGIEAYLNVAGPVEMIQWAEERIASGDDLAFDSDVLELASLPAGDPRKREEAAPLFHRIVQRHVPGFSVATPETEAYAQECLQRWCARFLDEELTPYQFCRIVHPIEEGFNFPAWLGDFYNQCDWIEPNYQPVDARHLYDYAQRYLAAIHTGDEPPKT
jgi:hypothetical protein